MAAVKTSFFGTEGTMDGGNNEKNMENDVPSLCFCKEKAL